MAGRVATRLDYPPVSSVIGRQGALGGGIWRPPTSGSSRRLAPLGHAILRTIGPPISVVQFNSICDMADKLIITDLWVKKPVTVPVMELDQGQGDLRGLLQAWKAAKTSE